MKSELASLTDLALSRGFSHSDLLSRIHRAVLEELKNTYPDTPINATVMADVVSGTVRIFSGEKDVTPKGFSQKAESIARQTVIQILEESPSAPAEKRTRQPIIPTLTKLLFWGYNAYLMFILAIILLLAVSSGDMSGILEQAGAVKTFLTIVLYLIPPGVIIWTIRNRTHTNAGMLARLLFLFEMPLVTLLAIPILLFGTLTGTVWFFVMILMLLPLSFYVFARPESTGGTSGPLISPLLEIVAVTTTYLGILYSIIYIPILIIATRELIGSSFSRLGMEYGSYSYNLVGLILELTVRFFFLSVIILITILPFLIVYIAWRSFLSTRSGSNIRREMVIAGIWMAFTAIISYQGYSQPLLDKLKNYGDAVRFEDRENIAIELLPNETAVRRAIEDISDLGGRYLFTRDDEVIKDLYQTAFKSMSDGAAGVIDSVFSAAAYPFIYFGPTDSDGKLSQAFTDLYGSDTDSRTDTMNVRLVGRVIHADLDAGKALATVRVRDQYTNTTYMNQEVIYEFSLPDGTVVTGLKLGPDLEFEGQIAPRGAAATVYQREVNRSRDPALLEQTGPRQWRLRVFPVPGLNDTTLGGKNQQVEFTYVSPVLPGGYPVPAYSKTTNLKIDGGSVMAYDIDGSPAALTKDSQYVRLADGSLPVDVCSLNTLGSAAIGETTARITFTGADTTASAASDCFSSHSKPPLSGLSIALLFDASRDGNKKIFEAAKTYLKDSPAILSNNTITLYRFNTVMSSGKKITADSVDSDFSTAFFGSSDLSKILKLPNSPKDADIIIIATDANQSLTPAGDIPLPRNIPVYMLHASNAIPPYSAKLTQVILSGGGASVNTLAEALTDYMRLERVKNDKRILSGTIYYTVETDETVAAPTVFGSSPFASSWPVVTGGNPAGIGPLVAHAYFTRELSAFPYDVSGNLPYLDAAHAFAKSSGIVTPYSSLIALVNATQQQMLDRESLTYDRYTESGTAMPQPVFRPLAPSVPILDSFMGIQNKSESLSMPVAGGGVNNFGALSNSDFDSSGSSIAPILILLLAFPLLAGVGGVFYLLFLVRKKRS